MGLDAIPIWALFVGAIAVVMISIELGYQAGISGSKRSLAEPILAISFAMVIVRIASLDRPGSEIIGVSQQPHIDLLSSMQSQPEGGK